MINIVHISNRIYRYKSSSDEITMLCRGRDRGYKSSDEINMLCKGRDRVQTIHKYTKWQYLMFRRRLTGLAFLDFFLLASLSLPFSAPSFCLSAVQLGLCWNCHCPPVSAPLWPWPLVVWVHSLSWPAVGHVSIE